MIVMWLVVMVVVVMVLVEVVVVLVMVMVGSLYFAIVVYVLCSFAGFVFKDVLNNSSICCCFLICFSGLFSCTSFAVAFAYIFGLLVTFCCRFGFVGVTTSVSVLFFICMISVSFSFVFTLVLASSCCSV